MSGGDPMQELLGALQAASSTNKQERDAATEFLMANSGAPGLSLMLMEAVANPTLHTSLRQAAAANLYSLVQRSWNPVDSPYPPIPDEDKAVCKGRVVALMLEVPKDLFKLVSGTLQVLSAHEFPHNWPELMPQLVERLQSDDPLMVIAILKTINSVLKYYRTARHSVSVVADLIAILKDFANPLKQLLDAYSAQFDAYQGNTEVLKLLLQMIKLMWEIVLSLTALELPQQFVDELPFWMEALRKFLIYCPDAPELLQGDDEMRAEPGAATKCHASVIRVLNQFVKKYDEDVEPYVQQLLQDVWGILQRVATYPPEAQIHYDVLVMEALNFLSTAITGVHHTVFGSEDLLKDIATQVILPNIRLTQSAFEAFEYEPLEFIRQDLEGSDSHTRRRSAIDLIKSIRRYYEESITRIFSDIVGQLLAEYAQNPDQNMLSKDLAIYLIIALAVTSQTRVKGVVATNSMINLSDFFESSIYPELLPSNSLSALTPEVINTRPLLKADCLRFVISFRRQLAGEQLIRLIPLLGSYLSADATVVASYAAIALDSFMTLKDGSTARLPATQWEEHMSLLFSNLFARISNPNASRFEAENPYVGATIARLITAVGGAIVPLGQTCLDSLTTKLAAIYKNPSSSIFVHCIFEGVAGVIQALIKNNRPELCEEAEKTLLPAFESIFAEQITDLIPYVYQLMAQLIEAKKNDAEALWKRYGSQFADFTKADHWERFANIPALTRLLSAYIRYAPAYVGDQLVAILGIFGRVNELNGYEKYAMRMVQDLLLFLDRSLWSPHLPSIFDRMLKRIRGSPGYQNQFIIFIATLCYLQQEGFGPDFVIQTFAAFPSGLPPAQGDLFSIVLAQAIIPHIPRSPDFKTVVAGFAQLLTSQTLISRYPDLYVPLLGALVDLTVGNKEVGSDDTLTLGGAIADEEKSGHADFAKLNFSGQTELYVVPRDIVPAHYLVQKLAELSMNFPGTLPGLHEQLPEESRKALHDLLASSNVSLS